MAKKTQISKELAEKVNQAEVIQVPLNVLVFDASQPRTRIDEEKLVNFAEGIKKSGLMHPIGVREVENGFKVVYGERRGRAFLLNKETHIPAKNLSGLTDDEILQLQVRENTDREDMSIMEQARAYARHANISLAEISALYGKTTQFIAERLLLNRLIPELQEAVELKELEIQSAKVIAELGENTQRALIDHIFEEVPANLLLERDGNSPYRHQLVTENIDENDYDNYNEYNEYNEYDEYDEDEDEDLDETEDSTDEEVLEESDSSEETETAEAVTRPQVIFKRKSKPFKEISKIIANSILDLSNAPFDLQDKTLHPAGLTCTDCPNRNCNRSLLSFAGIEEQDLCLDIDCFSTKISNFVENQRRKYAPTDGESQLAKTFTAQYYSSGNSFFDSETLRNGQYRVIKEDEADSNCEHSEFAVNIDKANLGKVTLICANHSCTKHFASFSSSSNYAEDKPELTKEERSLRYQNSRQDGYTRRTHGLARPKFFADLSADYNGLNWIFNDEDLRLQMIARFYETVFAEDRKDLALACESAGISFIVPSYSTSESDLAEAELLGYYFKKERTLLTDLAKIDEDRLSRLLFNLTFVKTGRHFEQDTQKADAELAELSARLDGNYELTFAEKQIEIADEKRKPFAEKYLADLKTGIERERPNLFTEFAENKNREEQAKRDAKLKASVRSSQTADSTDASRSGESANEADTTTTAVLKVIEKAESLSATA